MNAAMGGTLTRHSHQQYGFIIINFFKQFQWPLQIKTFTFKIRHKGHLKAGLSFLEEQMKCSATETDDN